MKDVISGIVKTVSELFEDKDECTDMLANVTTGSGKGQPDIDIDVFNGYDDGEGGSSSTVVGVKVHYSYDDCLADINTAYVPLQNARIWCLRVVLWQYKNDLFSDDFAEDLEEDYPLQESEEDNIVARQQRSIRQIRRIAPRNITSPRTGFRTRREYRTLSADERARFHNALNQLYQDQTMLCFALVHRMAMKRGGAHGGNAFLPWHRAFLSLFEEALRRVDDRVFLPYWDSSLDDNMPAGPGFSIMWDDDHLGTGSGVVDSGPFAGWEARETPLRRDIARGVGSLIRQSRIDYLMGFCRLADFNGRWEGSHNSVHRWIGGTMARSMAASDPIFYMHHAFIDYQWEIFRQRQRDICGIDPASDYPPDNDNKPEHNKEERMIEMRFLDNIDGVMDFWTDNWFDYEDSPSCSNNCGGSPDLFCDEDINLCVSEMRFDIGKDLGESGRRKQREISHDDMLADGVIPYSGECTKNPYGVTCVNPPPPTSDEEMIEALARDEEYKLPESIKKVDKVVQENLQYANALPVESEQIIFHANQEESNDCRNLEKCTYDLLKAVVKGRKITNRYGNHQTALTTTRRPRPVTTTRRPRPQNKIPYG
ncbi:putative tyrosinase-like protein tyr-3 [Mya arenaria]|uniref:putative tyrosinase-like protein tyr-3 n=1 Tax=Mya arenaria TaxID=6604 RepID=UPI0022E1FD85|nr:putative tyrosinase-like protein tyr-3 [Mya arenaria]